MGTRVGLSLAVTHPAALGLLLVAYLATSFKKKMLPRFSVTISCSHSLYRLVAPQG